MLAIFALDTTIEEQGSKDELRRDIKGKVDLTWNKGGLDVDLTWNCMVLTGCGKNQL